MDRKSLEEVMRKALRGRALRPGAVPRVDLVNAVAEGFRQHSDIAYLTMRALDRGCKRERHLVASMAEDDLDLRLTSYRAIDFRRERARLMWALLRDGREAHAAAAQRILDETFATSASGAQERRDIETASGRGDDDDSGAPATARAVEAMQERVGKYEAAMHELADVVTKSKAARSSLEAERSDLLVKLGQRERAVKAEEQQRKKAEAEAHELREQVRELREQLERLDPEQVKHTIEERDRLRDKARSLEAKVAHADGNRELFEENRALTEEIEELSRRALRNEREHQAVLRELHTRESAALERVTGLRDSLKKARQLASAPAKKDPSVVGGEPLEERVGVFVDASNLSASARREHGEMFDFVALLPEVIGRRKKVVAVSFVVDNEDAAAKVRRRKDKGDSGFSAFVKSLQNGGYEVRTKRAKRRADGTSKGDWDMGIAMEVLEARNRLDVIVLCTGDGDFLPLLHRLKKWGKRVEVASFTGSTDKEFIEAADAHHALEGRFRLGGR